MKEWAALAVAIVSDVLDYVGGFIPGFGDILDLITIPILFYLTGYNKLMLVGATELIPFVDFIPTYTILVLMHRSGVRF